LASDTSAKTLRTAGAERRSPRDQNVAGNPTPGGAIPSWDVTLNYVPIAYPAETPAIIQMKPGEREFWRVAMRPGDAGDNTRRRHPARRGMVVNRYQNANSGAGGIIKTASRRP
jgi:hypothetical protein